MTDRFCLRTSSAIGPLWYADGAGSPSWTMERLAAYPFPSALAARLWRKGLGLAPADCRVVRVGPKRRAPPAEKAPPAAPVPRGRVDGTSDARVAVSSPAARPEGSGAPKRYAVGFTLDGKPDGDVAHWACDERCEHVLTFATADEARAENDRRGWPGYVREYPRGSRVAPTAAPAPAVPERVPVTGTWCADSPVHEHAWQWRDGGLVCAHCGGRRVEAKA